MSQIDGNLVFAEVGRDHTAAVDHHAFHQRVSHTHHDAAVDLALMHERIQHGAGAVRAGEMAKLHLAGFRIDIHFGHLHAERRFGPRLEILVEASAANGRAIAARKVGVTHTPSRQSRYSRRHPTAKVLLDRLRAPRLPRQAVARRACAAAKRVALPKIRVPRLAPIPVSGPTSLVSSVAMPVFSSGIFNSSAATRRMAVCVPAP